MFRINDKVVCVDDSGQDANGDCVRKGVVYVVREVDDPLPGVFGVKLIGLSGGLGRYGERLFYADRFRKLDDIKAENAARRRNTTLTFEPANNVEVVPLGP